MATTISGDTLVTVISKDSTDNQIPTAKCVYDNLKNKLYVDGEGIICLLDSNDN